MSFTTEIKKFIKYNLLQSWGITTIYYHSQLINPEALLTKKILSNEVSFTALKNKRSQSFAYYQSPSNYFPVIKMELYGH